MRESAHPFKHMLCGTVWSRIKCRFAINWRGFPQSRRLLRRSVLASVVAVASFSYAAQPTSLGLKSWHAPGDFTAPHAADASRSRAGPWILYGGALESRIPPASSPGPGRSGVPQLSALLALFSRSYRPPELSERTHCCLVSGICVSF